MAGAEYQYQPVVEPINAVAPPPASVAGTAVDLWFQPPPVVIHIVEEMVAYGSTGIRV